MERGYRGILAAALVLWALAGASRATWACGPMLPRTVFTETNMPDAPVEEFLGGRLGILEPTYRRVYLVAAYRQLAGPPLDEKERAGLLSLVKSKMAAEASFDGPVVPEAEDPGMKEWIQELRRVQRESDPAGASPGEDIRLTDPYLQGDFHFKNCLDDAFKTAAGTLRERTARFGAGSGEVASWIEAQNRVFANCSGKETIPSPPEPGIHPLIARDRTYQIASAHFYALNFDKARELFEAVAKDEESPWRRRAPYLVGRVLLRKATLAAGVQGDSTGKDPEKARAEQRRIRALLEDAEKQFSRVIEDPSLAETHSAARGLLQLVRFKLHPVQSRTELARGTLSPSPERDIQRTASDYTVLLDRFMKEKVGAESFANIGTVGSVEDEAKAVEDLLASLDGEHDLTDWILTFQAGGDAALVRALKKYDEKGSLPWLMAVLSKIGPGHPRYASVAEAAALVPEDSPGYATAAFHLARCTTEAGKAEEARSMLDSMLPLFEKRKTPRSAVNRLLGLRLASAKNLAEFIRYAPRFAVRIEYSEAVPKDPLLDEDSTRILNLEMPLALLLETVQSPDLPENLGIALGRAVWVRALLLGNEAAALAAANFLKDRDGVLGPAMKGYLGAKDPGTRKYAGVLTILRHPGLRPFVDHGNGRETFLDAIDDYRDNWWDHPGNKAAQEESRKGPEPFFPGPRQKAAAAKEYKTLAALGSAPTYLSRFVASYGRENPSAPNLAEALHLAVKSTRFGLPDDQTGKYSKEAFVLLHKKYPKSEWAKKTPYWFK